ncbi:MAG: DUF2171 domain-containing protein [Hyphomicrobiales bacterium]
MNSEQMEGRIREHMAVVGSDNRQLGMVDHIDARDTIKLTKDSQGSHHWIPMSWVSDIDDKVHIQQSGEQAMKQWMSTPPEGGNF